MTDDLHRTLEALWRMESAKLIAVLTRMLRDVGLAEDLAHDALLAALEQWPEGGLPHNPGAWLMATAKRRAIDHLRRARMQDQKHAELGRELEEAQMAGFEADLDDDLGDDLLNLVFIACHPLLSREARLALTLRLLGGLSTMEIARAFLLSEATVAQRIVRAKRALAEAKAPFEVPRGAERAARLPSVLEVIYLIFNEGYSATAGEDWMRPQLCEEAQRLARILAELMPQEGEAHALVALLELQASRIPARTDSGGEPILLADQNRARWDRLLIHRGLTALERAEAAGPLGPYGLQAAIAACHARARTAEETDWSRIAALYAVLVVLQPNPVVELNRAVAVGMAEGPAAGLDLVDALTADPALQDYHLLPSVRGDLLVKLGRGAEAKAEFTRAAALTRNAREQRFLLARAEACP